MVAALKKVKQYNGDLRIATPSDKVREVLDLAAAGKVSCKVETRPLGQINEIFQQMRLGKLAGRAVVTP